MLSIIVLLIVFLQSLGQNLHANYKAQLNNKLPEEARYTQIIQEMPLNKEESKVTPKYRKSSSNILFIEENKKFSKHLNYKHQANVQKIK